MVLASYAATQTDTDGHLRADGGRVLTVCATGANLQAAHHAVYAAIDAIDWPEGFCRRDIGWRAMADIAPVTRDLPASENGGEPSGAHQ